jgi:hypothetical protein
VIIIPSSESTAVKIERRSSRPSSPGDCRQARLLLSFFVRAASIVPLLVDSFFVCGFLFPADGLRPPLQTLIRSAVLREFRSLAPLSIYSELLHLTFFTFFILAKMSLDQLPAEIRHRIASYVDLPDLFSLVSKNNN